MGLFRLLTFILVVIVAWRMIKNYQKTVVKRDKKSEQSKIPVREKMVKCELCDVHLPQEDAIGLKDNGQEYWFCSSAHRNSFKQQDS
ncbi:MAG: PP0621 family protein [Pseudohongiellaceae bacterium]|jgi:uncharacterized protein